MPCLIIWVLQEALSQIIELMKKDFFTFATFDFVNTRSVFNSYSRIHDGKYTMYYVIKDGKSFASIRKKL